MKQQKNNFSNQIYSLGLVIIVLFVLQATMTFYSTNQIRFEELSEAVRNVYFLQKHQIYDGISSNVGWYGSLLVIYNLFGFNLYTAKILKLILHLLSITSLAIILKKYLKIKHAWVLLLLFGLSPTLIYFNTLQTSYGIDMQVFPIVILLLFIWKNTKNIFARSALAFVSWFLIMLASISYGTSLAYWPIWGIFFLWELKKSTLSLLKKIIQVSVATAGFFLPIVVALLYLKYPAQLLYDPQVESGIFQGGGMGESINSFSVLITHLKLSISTSLTDIFVSGKSYYYELLRVEFSHRIFPWIVSGLLGVSILVFYRYPKSKLIISTGFLLILVGTILGGISDWFPGIRRMTPVLIGFNVILIGIWKILPQMLKDKTWIKKIGFFTLISIGLMIVYRLKIFPQNIQGLKLDSKNKAGKCFHLSNKTPRESLEFFVSQAQKNKPINVPDDCRLHELYPAIAGSCQWNHLNCGEIIFAGDEKFKKPKK